MTGRLMTGRLMAGRLMTWKYKISSHCPTENIRTPLDPIPIPSKESKKENPVQSSSPSSVERRMGKKEEVEGSEKVVAPTFEIDGNHHFN
jgi:hypothetical protein